MFSCYSTDLIQWVKLICQVVLYVKKYIKYNMHFFNFILCIYPLLGIHVNSKQIKSLDPNDFFLKTDGFPLFKKIF